MKLPIISGIALFLTILASYGQEIKSVKIGTQVWMAKNLDIETAGSKYYENNPEMLKKYGRLYTWDAAKNSCPAGWHLPSQSEWEELINKLGGEDVAAKELKPGGSSGFNALLAGLCSPGNFNLLGFYGTFWSSSNYDTDHAWYFYITSKAPNITSTFFSKYYSFSVRCIKNN